MEQIEYAKIFNYFSLFFTLNAPWNIIVQLVGVGFELESEQ